MTNIRLVSLFGAFAAAGGCVEPAAPLETILRPGKCGAWQCGANSPVVDNVLDFHDLHLGGLPNEAGLSLHQPALVAKGERYDLAIDNNKIVGKRSGATVLSGDALLGAEIWLDTTDASPAYKIGIQNVRTMDFPYPGDTGEQLEVYVFSWSTAGSSSSTTADAGSSAPTSTFSNLCSNPPFDLLQFGKPNDHQSFAYSELLGMDPPEALVFSGDRIDANLKLMSETADPSWFNFGCAGHALAKLQLTRNTLASTPPSPFLAPTHAMRQATLKLLVADYCGTGRAFTVAGQPLGWKGFDSEAKGDFEPVPIRTLTGIEALWNENGAICLNTPRVAQSHLLSAKEEFPDVRKDIEDECGRTLRPCGARPELLPSLRRSENTRWIDPSAKPAPPGIPVYKKPGLGDLFGPLNF